jgi:hypothetical protein
MPLSVSDGPGAWVSDFVNSEDPRFRGKTKTKRRQMALAAYYAKKRKNESNNSADQMAFDFETSSPVLRTLRELNKNNDPTTDLGNRANKQYVTGTNSVSAAPATGLTQASRTGQRTTGDFGPNNLNRPSLQSPNSNTDQSSSLTTSASSLVGTTTPSPRELSNVLAKNGQKKSDDEA